MCLRVLLTFKGLEQVYITVDYATDTVRANTAALRLIRNILDGIN